MIKILKEPNSLLYQKCERITDFNEAQRIADELLSIMKSIPVKFFIMNRWLGFAANQIGYSKRVIGLRNSRNEYQILINPIILEKRFPFPYIESCFSLKEKNYYLVKRYLWARVKYQDLKENPHETILRGPSALYQEIDHIDGIMVPEIGFRLF